MSGYSMACGYCGKTFRVLHDCKKRKYCSPACSHHARTKDPTKVKPKRKPCPHAVAAPRDAFAMEWGKVMREGIARGLDEEEAMRRADAAVAHLAPKVKQDELLAWDREDAWNAYLRAINA